MKVGDLGILGVPRSPDPPSLPPPPAIMLPQWQPSSIPGCSGSFTGVSPGLRDPAPVIHQRFAGQVEWIPFSHTKINSNRKSVTLTWLFKIQNWNSRRIGWHSWHPTFDTQHFTRDMTNATSGRLTESSTINIKAPPFQTSNYQTFTP